MKRLFSILTFAVLMVFGLSANANTTMLQDQDSASADTATTAASTAQATDSAKTMATSAMSTPDESATEETAVVEEEPRGFHQELKARFIEGDPTFMGPILLCLILGLAVSIERIIYLNMASTNSEKLASKVEDALNNGGVSEAMDVCRNTKGPVASIYYQGLSRVEDEGVDAAEKAVVAYGGVQMGQLEKNVSWISLFIALGPMLGFLGTVIGMILAFDKIAAAGSMSPTLVAGGIKVALLTTVFGLIVAMILQVFYNYIISKIDNIVNDMENASILLVDMLVEHKNK